MHYRPLGKTGVDVSALGLGCMRLPAHDPELAARVVDAAYNAGITYCDTNPGYAEGRCQHLTAAGLKGRGASVTVSGKDSWGPSHLDPYNVPAEEVRRTIETHLRNLGLDHLEVFQLMCMAESFWEPFCRQGVRTVLEELRTEGRIRRFGFTTHEEPGHIIRLLETGFFSQVTLPYNLLNRTTAPAIERAAELGIGVIAMNAVAGGALMQPPVLESLPGGAHTVVQACLEFVLANTGVSCALSGMETLEMVAQNVAIVEAFDGLTAEGQARIDLVMERCAALGHRFCTDCGYCMPCPSGVDIPRNLVTYNAAQLAGWDEGMTLVAAINNFCTTESARASRCVQCGACEEKCPNRLPIREQLAAVAAAPNG